MKDNPYQKEITGIVVLGALLLAVETWRRWDNLLSYAYFDDVILVTLAFVAAYFLYKKTYMGQLLWVFVCGYATCLIIGSFMTALTKINEIDASGFPTAQVIFVKVVMYTVVVFMSIRAFRLIRKYRFN